MTRSGFLKSLIGLVVAPKILSEIEFKSSSDAIVKSSASFITDLNELTPLWVEQMIKKYGTHNYKLFIETI